MTKTDQRVDSQPLELSAPIWIGLAVVVLLGVVSRWRQSDHVPTLDRGPSIKINRHQASVHQFTTLGVEVALPEGWIYLSVADDARSNAATLMHPASKSIVSLRANQLDAWPPEGQGVQEESFEEMDIEWISIKVPRMIVLDKRDEPQDSTIKSGLVWIDQDPRRLGRCVPRGNRASDSTHTSRDLIMILVAHPYENSLSHAVRELCDAIRFLGEFE